MIALTAALADDVAPHQRFVTYSAKIIDTAGDLGIGSSPTDLLVKVYFYSKPEELQQYEQILAQKDGQKKLQETIHGHYDLGQFRVGTPGLAYAIRLITWQETKKGRSLFLVANRYSLSPGSLQGRDPRDYPFTVIKLDFDDKGRGDGTYISHAKVHFNKKHVLEVQDYLTQPATVSNVRKEGE